MTELTQELSAFQATAAKRQAEEQAQAKAQREEQWTQQVKLGACTVIPFPKVQTQPFRSALTIEKNSLFVANQYKGDVFVREWETKEQDTGEPITHRLTVGKTDKGDRARGVLTQAHQDVFYRLLRLWGEQGHTLGEVDGVTYGSFTMSAYRLVMSIRNNNSVREYNRVRRFLQDMVSIPVVLENSYPWQKKRDRLHFTLLNGFHWNERSVDELSGRPKVGGESKVTVLFSSMVTESFLHRDIKTLLEGPYRLLGTGSKGRRGEVARLLYPYLDAQLAVKPDFHIRLSRLAERFGFSLHGKKSLRKQQFESAIRMLNSKLIRGEEYRLKIRLHESEDGTDYVLHARRELNRQLSLPLPLS